LREERERKESVCRYVFLHVLLLGLGRLIFVTVRVVYLSVCVHLVHVVVHQLATNRAEELGLEVRLAVHLVSA
jgi:hypothetical protein